jgi:hypothetical protein
MLTDIDKPNLNAFKLYTAVIYIKVLKNLVFVPGKAFQSNLMFMVY